MSTARSLLERRRLDSLRAATAIALVVIGLVCSQAGQAAASGDHCIEAIRARGTLRVAVLAEYPWLTSTGTREPKFGGPACRLVEAVAQRLGVRIETVPVSFDDKATVLSGGDVDVSAAPMLVTPARAEQADFIPYSVSAQCFFGRNDDSKFVKARAVDDLDRANVTIAAVAGTPAESWLAGRLPHAKRRAIPGSHADVPVDEVISGRADAAPIDKFFVAALLRQSPALTTLPRGAACLESREMEIPVGIAIAKDQPSFLRLVRETARETMPAIEAEEARVVAAGP